MANDKLSNAKKTKNDEFYTQYQDIEKEINAYLEFNPKVFSNKTILLPCDDPEWSNFTKYFAQNFERLGLKKLISTSYAPNSKKNKLTDQPTLFETESPKFDQTKSEINGKIFTLYRDKTGDSHIDVDDLEWEYLVGDGDFRSEEIKNLRDQADIIVTNPPFSLFREFIDWIIDAKKLCVVIGNMNAITYKETIKFIKNNQLWLGATGNGTDMVFRVPPGFVVAESDRDKAARLGYVGDYTRLGNSCWFTNLDHGRRHKPIPLMTTNENLKFSKHKQIRDVGYQEFDNYNAIEVPFTDAIPSDFEGGMGVPISFLVKYNPEQFEILDANEFRKPHQTTKSYPLIKDADGSVNGVNKYVRILIRHRKSGK
jgi:hypothetical protein